MENKPVTAVIVGAGHRAFVYSKLALTDPDKLKIVGVADPDKIRQKKAMKIKLKIRILNRLKNQRGRVIMMIQ